MLRVRADSKGFTIIEVMIVLVIAAVILLIVFLAVPALQRNSRNTQRNNDAARLSTTFQEYLAIGNPIPSGTISQNSELAQQFKEEANVQTFNAVQITHNTIQMAQNNQPSKNNIQFRTTSICNDAGNDVVAGTANGRVALLYWLESGSGGETGRCLQVR